MKMGALGLVLLGGGFRPSKISSLAFWHDPSNAGSVTLNVADVSQINDLTANARHASQSTGAEQPAYTAAAINGKAAITFTAANNDALVFASATGMVQSVPGFTFAGVASVAVANTQRILTVLTNGAGTRFGLGSLVTTGKLFGLTRRLDGDGLIQTNAATAAFTNNTPAFFCMVADYTNGTVLLQVDGTSETQAAAWVGGNGSTSNTASSVAPNYARTGANTMQGILAETAGYARALSTTEITNLRNYFRAKWGTA